LLLPIVADELNVRSVVFAGSVAGFGRWHAKPNFRTLGPKLGSRVKEVSIALDADDGGLAGRLAHEEPVSVATSGGDITIEPTDVDLTQEVRKGWGVASEGGVTVALDLELTDELRLEGYAREVVRAVQDARKAAGLEVSDRIVLGLEGGDELVRALTAHEATVAGETLATDVRTTSLENAESDRSVEIEGAEVRITLRRAG
ncbi:MAG: DUF5915 domain-containing protein, partial [Actinomycetota bacterium]